MSINQERAMLIALLTDMPALGPPGIVRDLDDLNPTDRAGLMCTCSAMIICETIWLQSGMNRERALQGLNGLVEGMRNDIKRRTDGKI